MPARALVVLLLMLNAGVATWWLLRPEPLPPAAWVQPADVPRLQLLDEVVERAPLAAPVPAPDPAPAPTPAAAAAPPPAPSSDAEVQRCMSFGPFEDATAVAAARAALQPLGVQRFHAREVVDAPRGWRVVIVPQADRAAADALAARIRAAGFDDLLVVPAGEEANAIALGRYGSEPAARRREASLRAAGFPGQAQPLGGARTRHWLDVAAGSAFDAAAARGTIGAARVNDLDCATFVAGGAAG